MPRPFRKLFLYLVSQDANKMDGAYREMVVVAPSAAQARLMHPLQTVTKNRDKAWDLPAAKTFWCDSPTQTRARALGDANSRFRIHTVVSPTITLHMLGERNKQDEY